MGTQLAMMLVVLAGADFWWWIHRNCSFPLHGVVEAGMRLGLNIIGNLSGSLLTTSLPPSVLVSVLVCSDYCNKILQTGWLISNRNLIWEAGESKVLADSVSVRAFF